MQDRFINENYPVQVWITSLLAGLFLVVLMIMIRSGYFWNGFSFAAVFGLLVFSVLFSLPALLAFYFSFEKLVNMNLSVIRIKSILCILGILITHLTMYLVLGNAAHLWGMNALALVYSAAIVIATFAIRLKTPHRYP